MLNDEQSQGIKTPSLRSTVEKGGEEGSKLGIVIISLVIILASFASGWYAGNASTADSFGSLSFGANTTQKIGDQTVDLAPFWKVWTLLNEKYVKTHASSSTLPAASSSDSEETRQKGVDDAYNRMDGAIKGMVASLGDPYTVYFTPEESKEFTNEIKGNFEGIGMEIGIKENILTVVSALKDTPAERAGIMSGDKVIKINDTVTTGLSTDQAINLIRGKKGTEVVLTILRGEQKEPQVIRVLRDVINIPTIESQMRSDGVFVIRLFSFTSESANLFRRELRKFVESNSNKLIVDLRGNPGGYLDAAVDIASWFLPQGAVVVRENQTPVLSDTKVVNVDSEQVLRSKGYDIFSKNLKMAILINGGSASASEILGGALQEYGIAKLVGTQSFGKGSVQELVPVTKDTLLKVTIARWLTPQGKSISDGGLTPDVEVRLTQEDVNKKNDVQMETAAAILTGKPLPVREATSTAATSTPTR